MNLVENKKYSIYGVVEDINDSLAETFSVVFRLNEKEKIILRFQNEYKEIISIGNILYIDGIAKQYKSKIHLYVNNFKDLDYMDIEAKEKERIRNEINGSKDIDYIELENYIEDIINNTQNEVLKGITSYIYNKYKNEFINHIAATKLHHAYRHGLLLHTVNSIKLAHAYKEIYKSINEELLYSAIILHDIMKIVEIDETSNEYSLKGKLIGHISLISEEIAKAQVVLGYEEKEEALLLSHIVLSHHDEPEFGSPKRPQIIEALVMHLCDVSDAKMQPTVEALEKTEIGCYSEPIGVNNKLKFYKHSLSK